MTKTTRATFFILIATAFWGMTFALIKGAVANLSVFDFVFWRFLIASLVILLFFHQQIQFFNKKLILEGMLLGIFFGAGAVTQTIALTSSPASTVSFITSFEVAIVPLLICILTRRWPSLAIVISVIITLIGVGLLTLTNHPSASHLGNIWALACAFCFAVYTLLAGKFSHSGHPITLTFVQLTTLCFIATLVNLFTQQFTLPSESHQWIAIIFCAVFASILSFYLQIRFQRDLGSTKTAIIFASEPIFATITAVLYINEQLNGKFFLGACLIFGGILLSEFKLKKKIIPQD